jgi:hypothetical protein
MSIYHKLYSINSARWQYGTNLNPAVAWADLLFSLFLFQTRTVVGALSIKRGECLFWDKKLNSIQGIGVCMHLRNLRAIQHQAFTSIEQNENEFSSRLLWSLLHKRAHTQMKEAKWARYRHYARGHPAYHQINTGHTHDKRHGSHIVYENPSPPKRSHISYLRGHGHDD